MIIKVNKPKDCPFVTVNDCGAKCNLDDNIHCWVPTWDDFPENCPLVKENVIIQKEHVGITFEQTKNLVNLAFRSYPINELLESMDYLK